MLKKKLLLTIPIKGYVLKALEIIIKAWHECTFGLSGLSFIYIPMQLQCSPLYPSRLIKSDVDIMYHKEKENWPNI